VSFETHADHNPCPNIGAAPATASTPELNPDPKVFVLHHDRNLSRAADSILANMHLDLES